MTGLQYSAGLEGPAVDFITGSDQGALYPTLDRFSSFLGTNLWFVGENITVADFVMFEYIMCACLYNNAYLKSTGNAPTVTVVNEGNTTAVIEPNPDGRGLQPLLATYANLQSFKVRFESLPAIAAYLSSDRFAEVKGMNNQHAKFR
jgi:glutathione S-transferase